MSRELLQVASVALLAAGVITLPVAIKQSNKNDIHLGWVVIAVAAVFALLALGGK
jgi:hypothetical protein